MLNILIVSNIYFFFDSHLFKAKPATDTQVLPTESVKYGLIIQNLFYFEFTGFLMVDTD